MCVHLKKTSETLGLKERRIEREARDYTDQWLTGTHWRFPEIERFAERVVCSTLTHVPLPQGRI